MRLLTRFVAAICFAALVASTAEAQQKPAAGQPKKTESANSVQVSAGEGVTSSKIHD